MELLTPKTFRQLIHHENGPCLSIAIPAHRTGKEVKQDAIRLKNMIKQARSCASDIHKQSLERLAEPVETVIERQDFRKPGCDGLAFFSSDDLFLSYCLPGGCGEISMVADHFYVKPLIPVIAENNPYYLLSLHQHGVRFYQGDRFRLKEIDLPGLPHHISDVLQYDDPERQIQFHTGTARPSGKRAAMFHGQGVGVDDSKSNIRRFFQEINRVVSRYLDSRKTPLIVAAVESLFPVYREVNTCPHLVHEWIDCHPQSQKESDLVRRAGEILASRFNQIKQEALEQFYALNESQTAYRIEPVLLLAYEGRINTLFADPNSMHWGQYEMNTEKAEIHEQRERGDVDLLNLAMLYTLRHGGQVIPATGDEIPGKTEVAAALKG